MSRLNLAIRRIVWLVGIMPVLVVAITITVVGPVFPLLRCGLLWLTGSRELKWDPTPFESISVRIVDAWDRLIEDPASVGKDKDE